MEEVFNPEQHVFRSPKFQGVVHDAIAFFERTPTYALPPSQRFTGVGVYALHYVGDHRLYTKIADLNRQTCLQPIYTGKAVPPGWRTARTQEAETPALYQRLREHTRSIEQAADLRPADFRYRFMILGGAESDLVVPVEAELIRRYKPLWNTVVDGFGNHDPGAGRYNQARSEWDIVHPGRPWAERLTGPSSDIGHIISKIKETLG